ncbi:tol-pal system protein YbgF [Fundidesulfovibrio terrae]|uniref:tol-pal system protein YbgF n=1 Tax=Fundidesulfovibrio terrae TaxID=2922866 RepID=UPI001FAFADEA
MKRPGLLAAPVPVLALALALGLSGCAAEPKPVDPGQMAQANMQADLTALKSRNQELRMRLEEIESILGKQGRGFTLEDVNKRLAQLEETVYRMAATLGVDAGTRAPSPSGTTAAPAGQYPGAPSGTPGSYGADTPPAGPISMGPGSTDPAEAIYNMAMEAYNQRDYDRANTLFSEMLKSYPSSRQAPGALFWQAETNYQQGDYARAALLCQDLIQKYPSNPMAASAMLKQGLCFRKLGKLQAAKILFQDVVKRYPGGPEARSAQVQLKELR